MAIQRLSIFLLSFLALGSIFFAIFLDPSQHSLSVTKFWQNALLHHIVLDLRLPRVACAFVTGGLLALAGVLMQVLLRNPLADPYVLGISSGASLAVLLVMLAGGAGGWLIGGAWVGSLFASILVFALQDKHVSLQSPKIILTGVALASGFSALVSLILFVCPDQVMRSMFYWLVGDFNYAHMPYIETGILSFGLIFSFCQARKLNILVRGKHAAAALGINVQALSWQLYFLSALLTATAVTLAGCIGFIGLIVPHALRLIVGYDHRIILPASVLLGGSLLTLAEALSRQLAFPLELPVGIVMALIGIPIFIFLLKKQTL